MFKKKYTLTEETVNAVGRLADEVNDLKEERNVTLSAFREAAMHLDHINKSLSEKSALCGSMIAQLKASQAEIAQQSEDNARVRDKILEIIGE